MKIDGVWCLASAGTNTVLTGDLDEAALYGVLDRILVLGLEIVELSRLPGRGK